MACLLGSLTWGAIVEALIVFAVSLAGVTSLLSAVLCAHSAVRCALFDYGRVGLLTYAVKVVGYATTATLSAIGFLTLVAIGILPRGGQHFTLIC